MGQKIDKTLLYKIPPQGGIGFSLDLLIEIGKNIFMAFKAFKKSLKVQVSNLTLLQKLQVKKGIRKKKGRLSAAHDSTVKHKRGKR